MHIERLTAINFGPFYEKHIIDLSVTSNAPLVIVHGENMRGKSSLQNAIRWCLYGQALGRMGTKKPTYRLISYDALDSHNYMMRVVLEFTHEEHHFELDRQVQSDGRPSSDADLEEHLTLRRDGHFLAEQDIKEVVDTVLHEDISRFFLFDGEMLSQYEQLVSEPGRDTDLIKQSIERILGLPALRLARKDLEVLHGNAERKQTRAVKGQQKSDRLAADAEQLRSEIESIDIDLVELENLRTRYEQDRDEAAEQRERYESVQADIYEAEQLDARILAAEREQGNLQREIRELLPQAWWEPVAAQALRMAESLEDAAQEALDMQEQSGALKQEVAQLEHLIRDAVCPICQCPAGSSLKHTQGRVSELNT